MELLTGVPSLSKGLAAWGTRLGAGFFKSALPLADDAARGALSLADEASGALSLADDGAKGALSVADDASKGAAVASGFGRSAPMQVVRVIKKGEKLADIINEGKSLTFTTGNEHALVKLASGERALVSGGPGGITFSEGQVTRIFGHTHPTSAPPSAADFEALRQLGQFQQTVLHGGQVTKIRP